MPAPLIRLALRYKGKRYEPIAAGGVALKTNLAVASRKAARVVKREISSYLKGVAETMTKRHSEPWIPDEIGPTGVTEGRLYKRRRGVGPKIKDSIIVTGSRLDNVRGAFKMTPILSTHEHGATIRVRRARYLTIPLPAALDDRGVPIYPRARDWPDTFVVRSRKGNLLIVQRDEDGLIPLYVLKKSVVIPERLGLAHTMRAGKRVLSERAKAALTNVVADALGSNVKVTAEIQEVSQLA